MKRPPLTVMCVLFVALTACKESSQPETLYEIERMSVDSHTSQFRDWAQSIVAIIAENDKDLEATVELVELEQKRELSLAETERFSSLQKKIQVRNTQISKLFDQGGDLQVDLFSNFYRYLGKLDSGAQYCGKDDLDIKKMKLPGLTNQSAWPQLEEFYLKSFTDGRALLNTNRDFPCKKFLPTYETLRGEIETKIDSINRLLNSLDF